MTNPSVPAALTGSELAWDSLASFAHQTSLAQVRDELLAPVNTVLQLVELLIEDVSERTPSPVISDLLRIREATQRLCRLVDEWVFLSPMSNASEPAGKEAESARIRHEINTALNVVVNYSEILQEDAPELLLDGFVDDLRLIQDHGRRCERLFNSMGATRPHESIQLTQSAMKEDGWDTSSATGRILVVDDLEDNRKILARLLEKQGHCVRVAANGEEALAQLTSEPFDLIFLDLLMPGLDGLQVLERLREDTVLRHLPVIMVSALEENASAARCIQLGAVDYLTKPYDRVLLRARTRACLQAKRGQDRERGYLRQIEQERRRADELLHAMLPAPIVRELKATGTVKPRRHERVAVMFADVVGFTSYCSRHSPEIVVQHLQALLEVWEESGQRHGVHKIKTIGDAFMGAAGLLEPLDEPVMACIRCGAEFIDATRRLHPTWRLRVGVHVGQVVAGLLGRRQHLFDLWGDTVNTASRMESVSLPDVVTLSEPAWQAVAAECVGEQARIDVDGKGSMTVWRFRGFRNG